MLITVSSLRLTAVHFEIPNWMLDLDIGHCRYPVSKLLLQVPNDLAHLSHIHESYHQLFTKRHFTKQTSNLSVPFIFIIKIFLVSCALLVKLGLIDIEHDFLLEC